MLTAKVLSTFCLFFLGLYVISIIIIITYTIVSPSVSTNITLLNAGLFVDTCGYLGTSPDGVVVDGSGQRVKFVER